MVSIRTYKTPFGVKKGLRLDKVKKQKRPSQRRGKLTKSTSFHRDLIKDIVGFAPFEKRILELLRTDREKRALKFAKAKIGGHRRAKRKREDLQNALRNVKK